MTKIFPKWAEKEKCVGVRLKISLLDQLCMSKTASIVTVSLQEAYVRRLLTLSLRRLANVMHRFDMAITISLLNNVVLILVIIVIG